MIIMRACAKVDGFLITSAPAFRIGLLRFWIFLFFWISALTKPRRWLRGNEAEMWSIHAWCGPRTSLSHLWTSKLSLKEKFSLVVAILHNFESIRNWIMWVGIICPAFDLISKCHNKHCIRSHFFLLTGYYFTTINQRTFYTHVMQPKLISISFKILLPPENFVASFKSGCYKCGSELVHILGGIKCECLCTRMTYGL